MHIEETQKLVVTDCFPALREILDEVRQRKNYASMRGAKLRMSPKARWRLLVPAFIAALKVFSVERAHASGVKFETVTLTNGVVPTTIQLAYRSKAPNRHSVILMLGSLDSRTLPAWSTNLVNEGFMLAAFTVAHPPDPDPARRPQWLYFDQRFAHSYVLASARAGSDAKRIIDYLITRRDVKPDKIGWLGSSSTGIVGLAAATQEPRLAAIVAFVSTGAQRHWLATWHTNGLWRGSTKDLWPETEQLLQRNDPILHASKLFPCAVLMVSGGEDKVVDPASARAFVDATRPYYAPDPERLRLVIYEGSGHNLPIDIVQMYAEHWFRLYLSPKQPPPKVNLPVAGLEESVRRTRINDTEHEKILNAK